MATNVITPGVSAVVSGDIDVPDTSGTILSLYTDTGVDVPYGVVLKLQRKTFLDNFEDVSTVDYGFVRFKTDSRMIIITTPGTYRVVRPDISYFGVNVGLQLG